MATLGSSDHPGAPPARRPLVAAALALLSGSSLGLLAPWLASAWLLALAAAAGFGLGALTGEGASARRARLLSCLFVLVALQASRSSGLRSTRGGSDWVPRPVEGRWEPLFGSEDSPRGLLLDGAAGLPAFELPQGFARAGEWLRLSPGSGPSRGARGPAPASGSARGTVRLHPDEVERIAPPDDGLAAALLGGSWREALAARCDAFDDPTASALARAVLLGDLSRLTPGEADLFARTGLSHLLAVSGLHVVLFAALVAAPLAQLVAAILAALVPRSRAHREEIARVLLALGVVAYVPLAGSAPPVRRAVLAAVLGLLAPLVRRRGARALGRSADALSLWSAALLLECVADPAAPASPSIQLSYAATLGLVLAATPLERALRGLAWLAPRPRLAPGPIGRALDVLAGRALRSARMALAASLAAVLATLPFSWARFGEWSPAGIVLTPVAVVLFAWMLPAGLLAVLAPIPIVQTLFATPGSWLIAIARAGDALPGTPCPLPERPAWLVLAVTALTFAWISLAGRGGAMDALRRVVAASWGVLLVPWTLAPAQLELVALDVGHGTAVAWRAPGAGTWIFDAGSRDRTRVGRDALAPLLARWESAHPAVVLSHDDLDHQAGLSWLVERYPPRLWAGALPALLSERLPHTTPRLDLESGDLRLVPDRRSPSLDLRLLRGRGVPGNEGSRSLWLAWNGRGVLLCGDAEQEGLRDLLELWRPPSPLAVLLLPHHGSHSPWLGPLLGATRPAEVWISCSSPPPVAAELARRGLAWRATALEGPLTLNPGLRAPEGGLARN